MKHLLLPICICASVLCVRSLAAEEFATCINGLKQRANNEGIESSLVALLDTVSPIERVIDLDRNQPEYTQTFADYLNARVTDNRIERGGQLLKTHRGLLNRLTREYGIPPQYLIAFWGLETNFGSYLGLMPILDSLATLACDQRRSEQFTRELLIALTLVGDHELELESFKGSWAGAMGHTQFMPSVYQRFGTDGDGDGKVDLWNSVDDALTSAANYLQNLGWQRSLRWGREVQLPNDFDYYQSGIEQPQTLAAWRQLGVRRATGGRLDGDANLVAALIVPQGVEGPKFLVYENFHVILNWNTPIFYALSVGYLADRINGAGRLHQLPPETPGLSFEEVKAIQLALSALEFEPGGADGRPGPATQKAVREFQHSINVVADGFVDHELLQQLQDRMSPSQSLPTN